MPKQNAIIARVSALPAARGISAAAEASAEAARAVRFEDGRTALLPTGRRAPVWQEMLDHLRNTGTPAYVEVDPETSIIIRLLIPRVVRVHALEPAADGNFTVTFIETQTGHHLLRSNPEFLDLLNALEAARDAGTAVLVTATRDDHEIIDVRPAPPAPPPPPGPASAAGGEGAGGGGETVLGGPPSVVSEAEAVQLFNEMAALVCNPLTVPPPCITFNFPDDGCYARAHEMIRLMRLQGIEGEKIWIFAGSNSDLNPFAATHPNCEVNWWYHVAPTLQVNTSSGIEKRVIDPSLMTGPATQQQWKDRQNDPAAKFEFTDATPFWPNNGGNDDDYTLTNQYLQQKRLHLQERSIDYGPPPYACPIVKQCAFIVDRSTFGQDEITAMLANANPAVIEAAFYVILDGFTPQEIGITSSTPTDPPAIKPAFNATAITQMEIKAAHLDLEDPAHLIRRQRITWTYEVRFTGIGGFGFGGSSASVNMTATISGETANASLTLIKQPNPFEIDGATSWLSTDLRVFQINAGASKFGATMGADGAQAPAFIQQVINNLTNGTAGGQTFDNDLSTDQNTSRLELSHEVGNVKVFNFAVARVRYIGTLQAENVRVFFRLFPASTTSLAFDQSTTYRRAGTIPLLGLTGSQLRTIPCFAWPRVDSASAELTTQTDPPNVRTIPASPTERWVYFGAWLDINQLTPQFPPMPAPADGPWSSGRDTIQNLVRFQHQCLVAEIAFDPAPIPAGATPGGSDKLAQRNLSIIRSANPGVVASRRIPQTFEIRPTQSVSAELPHDELMIDWGRTPVGSTATIYLPDVNADEVLELAASMYRTANLWRIDEHTLQTYTGGMSWIPIPRGDQGNFTGLLTIDLPPTVRAGQAFTVVARQVTGFVQEVIGSVNAAAVAQTTRYILGSFQISIPVSTKDVMLGPEVRLLSNLRSIERGVPKGDAWYDVFRRYVRQVASRVDALGGDSSRVEPSPSGDGDRPSTTTPAPGSTMCTTLELLVAGLIVILILLGATAGAVQIVLGLFVLAVLFAAAYIWFVHCRPSGWKLLRAVGGGVLVGLIVLLAVLML
jgi:Glutaminase